MKLAKNTAPALLILYPLATLNMAYANECDEAWKQNNSARTTCDLNTTASLRVLPPPDPQFQHQPVCELPLSCFVPGTHPYDPSKTTTREIQNKTDSTTRWMLDQVKNLKNCDGIIKLKC